MVLGCFFSSKISADVLEFDELAIIPLKSGPCSKASREDIGPKKSPNMFMKADCKHLKFTKLWASHKLGGIVAKQPTSNLEGKLKRKGV